MKPRLLLMPGFAIAVTFIVCGVFVCGQTFAKDVPKKTAKLFSIPRVPEVSIPASVFNIPSQPAEGRNPFYPQSTAKLPTPQIPKDPLDSSSLVLNGITSPPRRTAMINGRTFETGEEGEVRMPSGSKILIKVEEIKAESAIILVGGVRRELRLRAGV